MTSIRTGGETNITERNNDTLASLEVALNEAINRLSAAKDASQIARRNEVETINRVNDLQKRIDARVAEIKSAKEMRGTDWGRDKGVEAP